MANPQIKVGQDWTIGLLFWSGVNGTGEKVAAVPGGSVTTSHSGFADVTIDSAGDKVTIHPTATVDGTFTVNYSNGPLNAWQDFDVVVTPGSAKSVTFDVASLMAVPAGTATPVGPTPVPVSGPGGGPVPVTTAAT